MKFSSILFFLPSFILLFACKKAENKSTSKDKLFTFNALTSDKDTILKGNVTNLRANVTGSGTFKWSASAGDLFGSGSVILFGASTCCTGNHSITCTVTDSHDNSESKTISVYVK